MALFVFTMRTSPALLAFLLTLSTASALGMDSMRHRCNCIEHAASSGNVKEIQAYLAKKGHPDGPQDPPPVTPLLHFASRNGHEPVALLLLDAGADITARDLETGRTALHAAIIEKREIIARLFLTRGAHVDAPDARNRTPLQCVAQDIFRLSLTQARPLARLLLIYNAEMQEKQRDWNFADW